MQRPGHSRVILDLALDEEPICGWVRTGHEPERAFAGWLSLGAALDRARRCVEADDPGGAPAAEGDAGPLAAGE